MNHLVIPIFLVNENNHGHVEIMSIKYKGEDNHGNSIVERMFGAAFKIGSDSSVIRELNLGDDFTKYFSFQFSIFSNQTTSSVLPSGTSCTLALMLSFFALKEENLLLHEFINDSIILGAISNNGTVQKLDGDGFVTKCITINNFIATAKDTDDKDYKYFRNKKYLVYPSENQQEFLQVEAQIKKLGIQAKSVSNIHDLLEEYKEDTNTSKLKEAIKELVTPNKQIINWNHFWRRYKKSIFVKEVAQIINVLEKPQDKKKAIDILQKTTNVYYEKYARKYFSREAFPFRYDAVKISLIGIFIIFITMVILPSEILSAKILKSTLMFGIFFISIHGLIMTAADFIGAYNVYQVTGVTNQDITCTKTYYFKSFIKWLKKRFTPVIFYSLEQFLEGIMWRVLSILGIYYLTLSIGLWGIFIAFLIIFIDFYRGEKKFDNVIINKIKQESINDFLNQYKNPLNKEATIKIQKNYPDTPKDLSKPFTINTFFKVISILVELFRPEKYIKSKEQFWQLYKNKIAKDPFVFNLIYGLKDPKVTQQLSEILQEITNECYEKYGESYFKARKSNIFRYSVLFLVTLPGAFITAKALLTVVSGGPLAATAGIILGLVMIGYGAMVTTLIDIWDCRKAQKAIEGKFKIYRSQRFFNYLKNIAQNICEIVLIPFSFNTYKSLYYNRFQMIEGIVCRAISFYGGGYTPMFLGVWGQIAIFIAIPVDFYRGRKKFDHKVINKIKQESIKQFVLRYPKSIGIK